MNYQRILDVSGVYFLLTGYQIRSLDAKTHHYRQTLWGALHFLILVVCYLICFEHHMEKSAIMKIVLDLSPFLKNLIIVHIWLGLKAFVFCIVEWRSLTRVINGLAEIVLAHKDIPAEASDKKKEILAYFLIFGTLLVAICIGLYIAIEMKFELPPIDTIMIATALFVPHLTLAGCLRLYNLRLWLLRHEMENLKGYLNPKLKPNQDIVIEIINSVNQNDLSTEIHMNSEKSEIYHQTLQGLESISNYLDTTNIALQRQLCVLNGLNFNCLLYGIYTRLYFDKTWNVMFTGSRRRVFYASNISIFICIYLDYALLLLVQFSFNRMKHDFSTDVKNQIDGSTNLDKEKCLILEKIQWILKEKLNFKLYGLMDFNFWNFLIVQILMLLIIAIIVLYQYFNDQMAALTEQMESNDID